MSQHARDAREVQKFMERRTDVQRYAVAYGGRGAPALSADGHLRDPSDDPCPPGVEPLTTAFGQYVYFLNLSVRAIGTKEQERLRRRAAEANESNPPLELVWPATEAPPNQQSIQKPSLATKVVGFGCRQWCKLFSGGEKEPDGQTEGTTTAKAPYIGILAQREARERTSPTMVTHHHSQMRMRRMSNGGTRRTRSRKRPPRFTQPSSEQGITSARGCPRTRKKRQCT